LPIFFIENFGLSSGDHHKNTVGVRITVRKNCTNVVKKRQLTIQTNLVRFVAKSIPQRIYLVQFKVACVLLQLASSSSSCGEKRSRNWSREKWRATSSSWSTTHDDRAFLWAWRWKIFSSIVPVASSLRDFVCKTYVRIGRLSGAGFVSTGGSNTLIFQLQILFTCFSMSTITGEWFFWLGSFLLRSKKCLPHFAASATPLRTH